MTQYMLAMGQPFVGNLKNGGTFLLQIAEEYCFVWSDFSRGSGVFSPLGGGKISRLQICASGLECVNKVRILSNLDPVSTQNSFLMQYVQNRLNISHNQVNEQWLQSCAGLTFCHPGSAYEFEVLGQSAHCACRIGRCVLGDHQCPGYETKNNRHWRRQHLPDRCSRCTAVPLSCGNARDYDRRCFHPTRGLGARPRHSRRTRSISQT